MITMRDRVRRPIQANLKRFIFVVVVFSLALCLLGQIAALWETRLVSF